MTHDELLAEIKSEIKQCSCFPYNCEDGAGNRPWEALRAVVELHHPWIGTMNPGPWCRHCEDVFDASIAYPCPTIQAIEKELQ